MDDLTRNGPETEPNEVIPLPNGTRERVDVGSSRWDSAGPTCIVKIRELESGRGELQVLRDFSRGWAICSAFQAQARTWRLEAIRESQTSSE